MPGTFQRQKKKYATLAFRTMKLSLGEIQEYKKINREKHKDALSSLNFKWSTRKWFEIPNIQWQFNQVSKRTNWKAGLAI